MMKTKYNKKRNTAFVYEALVREGTSAILQGDHDRKNTVVKLIKKHFTTDSILYKDLQCYQSLVNRIRSFLHQYYFLIDQLKPLGFFL